MDLGSLKYATGSIHKRRRVGRGLGSGFGGTAGRGQNGQRSRSGSKKRAWFEGGQMPLQRRLPKRGFTNIFKKEFQLVNLRDLERIDKVTEIGPEVLRKTGLVKKKSVSIKILGQGELKKALTISAHAFSESAKDKIEKAGGTVKVL